VRAGTIVRFLFSAENIEESCEALNSAHSCSENIWEECVVEKRLRFFGKMGVVVLLLRSLTPIERHETNSKTNLGTRTRARED